jgi:hypothetical protein
MTLREWQASQNIDRDAQVKITKLSHMRYQHPDLTQITTFLRDFGMSVAQKAEGKRWFKGYGTDQYVYYAQEGEKKFLGGAFEVESYAELEKCVHVADPELQRNSSTNRTITGPQGYQAPPRSRT